MVVHDGLLHFVNRRDVQEQEGVGADLNLPLYKSVPLHAYPGAGTTYFIGKVLQMDKLKVSLESCYGIKKLDYDFDFKDSPKYSIYAPNGFMKTSFSKCFMDLSKNVKTKDQVFPERVSKRIIQDEAGVDIPSESIFVIEPYNPSFSSEKASLLLVNKTLKNEYESALSKIDERKYQLIEKLKQLTGITGKSNTPEQEILKCFGGNSILETLEKLGSEVPAIEDKRLSGLVYNELFNDKTLPFLEAGNIKTELSDYIDRYNELIDKSPILSKDFNHYHAKVIQRNLAENGFFSANHSVNLFNGITKEEITTAEDLDKKIESEKKKILSDDSLQKKFEGIDKKLKNEDLRKFRDYLFDNKDIVAELADYKKLQKNIILSYIKNQILLYEALITEYKISKSIIEKVIDAANKEKTDWEQVVETFNSRFTVPFKIEIKNQGDVILKNAVPFIAFTFTDSGKTKLIQRDELLAVLSQGERRALYILDILFEIIVRIKSKTKTILIVDDIADSFDYKNKYSIVEYLKEVSASQNFNCIFMTHNFDFHRTISGRLNIRRQKRLFAIRNDGDITLSVEKYHNPFEYWKDHICEPRFTISTIPFARNLAQYCGWPSEYLRLTSLLHIKNDSHTITVKDLEVVYSTVFKDKAALILPDPAKTVIDFIFQEAESILPEPDAAAELESKIILSIATRLKAEMFMIGKITDKVFIASITKNQTQVLFEKFQNEFSGCREELMLLGQVNLMTPENIHINSFMYEPILDLGIDSLKKLYTDIKKLAP